jgi:hypothetical protein
MANYVYNLRDVERNQASYKREYKVAALQHIELLAKQFSFGPSERVPSSATTAPYSVGRHTRRSHQTQA